MWGSDPRGSNVHGNGPKGIGGALSRADRRIVRYIAARLGPLPAWSIGYGIDVHAWAGARQLREWYDYFHDQLGGWSHFVGGRAHHPGTPPRECYWYGDYAGYTGWRTAYDGYVETLANVPDRPAMQEDRFRIRLHELFFHKDYDADMTVRGLWHSTLAGGVANIWGNLMGDYEDDLSRFYNGQRHNIDIARQIKTYSRFFFEKKRFRADLVADNALTDYEPGVAFKPWAGGELGVCSRSASGEHYCFYRENCRSVRMDLSGMPGPRRAVAVDVFDEYRELDLGELQPENQTWAAPYRSTWAIAVGDFK
jgi:hypothetical protein